jgi:hypothetical protein
LALTRPRSFAIRSRENRKQTEVDFTWLITVGEYDAATGEAINANLSTGLRSPHGLVVAANMQK